MPDAARRGLSVRLGQPAPVPLEVAFECGANELLALVGPSGSGKTSVLRAIAGLLRPVAGHVRCAGSMWFDAARRIHVAPHRRAVGLVFQSYALFPHMTALANVAVALGHHPRPERRDRARALLGMTGLDGLEARRPAELSGGQQQRVAVARALARDPEVLLLDEPFAAIDRRTRRRLRAELAELRQVVDMPVLMVTHDLDEAASLADRVCVLDAGTVLQIASPREILEQPSRAVREVLGLEAPASGLSPRARPWPAA